MGSAESRAQEDQRDIYTKVRHDWVRSMKMAIWKRVVCCMLLMMVLLTMCYLLINDYVFHAGLQKCKYVTSKEDNPYSHTSDLDVHCIDDKVSNGDMLKGPIAIDMYFNPENFFDLARPHVGRFMQPLNESINGTPSKASWCMMRDRETFTKFPCGMGYDNFPARKTWEVTASNGTFKVRTDWINPEHSDSIVYRISNPSSSGGRVRRMDTSDDQMGLKMWLTGYPVMGWGRLGYVTEDMQLPLLSVKTFGISNDQNPVMNDMWQYYDFNLVMRPLDNVESIFDNGLLQNANYIIWSLVFMCSLSVFCIVYIVSLFSRLHEFRHDMSLESVRTQLLAPSLGLKHNFGSRHTVLKPLGIKLRTDLTAPSKTRGLRRGSAIIVIPPDITSSSY